MIYKKITQLTDSVISHIAAGQVVERPASVVKELLENSLDAGATKITLRIEEGGKSKIVVQDNGCGINETELTLAVQPHTTSKISNLDDLERISTFGFRGEALSSIARSGTLYIQSKQHDAKSGFLLTVENGKVLDLKPVGMGSGTIVTLENIFQTMPARKKFLRSAQTEFQYILEVVTELALAHPAVSLQLFHNRLLVCDFLPTNFSERVQQILGKKSIELFLPIFSQVSDYVINGYLGTPQAAAEVTQQQILLVNKRPVKFLPLSKTIKKVFGSLLPPSVHPPFILHIELDPKITDVNIHPQKKQIAFSEQELFLDVIHSLIKQKLAEANLLFKYEETRDFVFNDSAMDETTASILREVVEPWNVQNFSSDEPILQVKKLYLVAQTKNGMILVDQHAAHERILYEEYKKAFELEKIKVTKLTSPIEIRLPIIEAQQLRDSLASFEKMGFIFLENKQGVFECTQVPQVLQNRPLGEYILETLSDIKDDLPIPELDYQSHRTIAYLACRTAIKAGAVLDPTERKNILEKLSTTTSKYTCPHGRPVLVHVGLPELAQMFYRIPASRKEK